MQVRPTYRKKFTNDGHNDVWQDAIQCPKKAAQSAANMVSTAFMVYQYMFTSNRYE